MEILPADIERKEKKDLISMYRRALINGNVNISVHFNKLANNF